MAHSWFDEEFDPVASNRLGLDESKRIANAAEYTANHVGRISRALERIAVALEKKQSPDTDGGDF